MQSTLRIPGLVSTALAAPAALAVGLQMGHRPEIGAVAAPKKAASPKT